MSCQLIGLAHLGRDAQVRYTNSGEPVAGLSLAFSYGRKGPDGKKPTQWVDAALWGKLAEALAPYLTKGTQVYVVLDDVHVQTYQKRDGDQGVSLVGRVSTIDLAGGRESNGGGRDSTSKPEQPSSTSQQAATGAGFDDMDDDIPF